jgi:hypothetical protein
VLKADHPLADRSDPYPHLEPLMEKFDILAQENEALEHFNTGWLWMRRGKVVADAWRAVLVADLHVQSRDQVFFNEVSCRMFSLSLDQPTESRRQLMDRSFGLNTGPGYKGAANGPRLGRRTLTNRVYGAQRAEDQDTRPVAVPGLPSRGSHPPESS